MKTYSTLWMASGLFLILLNSCFLFLEEQLTIKGFSIIYLIRFFWGSTGLLIIGSILFIAGFLSYKNELAIERKFLLDNLLSPL